ncbi:hypothetical protein [Actinoalloteichus hymeniacidonis]|uniref:hypothetical protein n=1 Tax=Actinoalloteichus hymeniacidonis TaxID=340345 RepID=UPI0012FA4A72|nr:hypothetical protein [Actinoalloteichus hymeniacidonis]MBB5907451.1 hypothetical protein [Actinoalloteichus hymeniacidonis]
MTAVPPPSEESLLGHVFLVPHRSDERTQHAATRTVLAALGQPTPSPVLVAAYTELLQPYYHSLWCPRAILTALDRNPEQRAYPMNAGAAADRLAEQDRRDRGAGRSRDDEDRMLTPMERVVRSRLGNWNRSTPPMEGFRSLEELSAMLHRRAQNEHRSTGPVAAPGTRERVTSRFRRPTRADAVRRVRESQDKIRNALDRLGPAFEQPEDRRSTAEISGRAWESTQRERTTYYFDTDVTAAELPAVQALRSIRNGPETTEPADENTVAELTEAARRALIQHQRQRRRASRFRVSMNAIDAYLESLGGVRSDNHRSDL